MNFYKFRKFELGQNFLGLLLLIIILHIINNYIIADKITIVFLLRELFMKMIQERDYSYILYRYKLNLRY